MSGLHHGGRLDEAVARYGGKREDWLDLSTGINPRAYPLPELPAFLFARLPESAGAVMLKKAAQNYYRVPARQQIVVANGTQAIIQVLPRMFGKNVSVDIISPTYDEHAYCWRRNGAKVREVATLEEVAGNIVVLVNPNNPDGRVVDAKQLQETAKQLSARNATLIVDEAFCDCRPDVSIASAGLENVIVLKSFGKFFGLAGVRLGFAICAENHANIMREEFGPWSTSATAEAIGTKALQDQNWIEGTRYWVDESSKLLQDLLLANCFDCVGNAGLFVTVAHDMAEELYEHLCENRILTRAFSSNPKWLRFGLCENAQQLERLETVLRRFGG